MRQALICAKNFGEPKTILFEPRCAIPLNLCYHTCVIISIKKRFFFFFDIKKLKKGKKNGKRKTKFK